ncbi:hypothetical protein ACOMHN_040549 [Nucella lapillus]
MAVLQLVSSYSWLAADGPDACPTLSWLAADDPNACLTAGVTELACFLLVDSVRKACETFLLEHLTIDTCLSSLHLAHRFDLPHLFRNTYRILQGRFHDHFIHQPEMLTTPASCLRQLTRIHTYVPLHDLVQFLTRWVDASDDGKGGGSGGRRGRVDWRPLSSS